MNATPEHTSSIRRGLRALLAVLVGGSLALGGYSVAAATPSAGTSSDAALTWGVKESWRSYISGGGTVTFTGDAAQTSGAETYTWSPGEGSYDGATGTATASFVGSVNFSYPTHYLNVVVADPSIEYVEGEGGTLSAVVGGTEVVFATLGDGSIDPIITGGVAEFAGIPAILTEDAAEAFIGYYPAGTELDPITLRVPVSDDGSPEPTGTPTPTPTKTPTPTPTKTSTPTPTPTKTTDPVVTEGALTWAIKSSFIAYLATPLADGTVTLSDDATEMNGLYRFPQESGELADGRGTLGFGGAINFSGHHGEMDVTISDFRVTIVDDNTARLSVVFNGNRVNLASLDLAAATFDTLKDGAIRIADIPTTLLKSGMQVFAYQGSPFYTEGTALEPLTIELPATSDIPTPRPTPTPSATPEPTPTPTITPSEPGAGWLGWGVRSSFRSYIVSPVANGSISLSGGASARGSQYVFPQSGGTFDAKTGLGTAQYRGSVHFYGHGGELSFSFSDLAVSVDSPSSARLSIAWGDGRIDIATLALDAGLREVDSSGAIHYSLVPATLTGDGSTAFRGFYGEGERLDPIDFVIGSAGSDVDGPLVVVAASETPETREPAPEPPATTGLTLAPGTTPVAGGRVTVQADGFEPGETGIIVVIYSTPVLLGTIDADERGSATWAGALPVSLTGKHTLTFQGSVARGIELDIAAADQAGCTVESAELEWGFKETFRAYISGTIANGEWQVLDGATYETPTFGWSGGGTFDAEGSNASASPIADLSFQGGIRFVGHGGVLDTTVSDPRLVITEASASLLLDVVGETQSGVAVDAAEVPFADLDLSTAVITSDGDVITIAGIGATLTEQGSAAFGTYPAGDPLDALTVRVTLPASCDTVVLPTAEPQPTQAPAQPDSGEGLPLWAVIVMVVLGVVVVGSIVVIVMLLGKRTA